MRLHRFYLEQKVGEAGEVTLTDSELIHQLMNVFRFDSGDKVILFDGSDYEFEAEIISVSKKEIGFKILNKKSHFADATRDRKVSLYLALIKKGNFDWAVEKCTEIGVSEIQPIISERSEKKDINLDRLNKIVKEASEQSGRVTLPKVYDIKPLELAVSQARAEGKECVVFHTSTASTTSASEGHSSLEKEEKGDLARDICVFVGCEGGWSDAEMNLFKQNNFKILSLGQNILRAETAAIVAVWSQIIN